MRRVLVCGGRDFHDYGLLCRAMDRAVERWGISVLIHGAARGADSLADQWAKKCGIPVEVYPADWETYKRAAGMIRNRQMLIDGRPDLVIAFPGGTGTAGMIRIATEAGVPVYQIRRRLNIDPPFWR